MFVTNNMWFSCSGISNNFLKLLSSNFSIFNTEFV